MAAPVFSVVVPTYERPVHLRRCLEALARLDYPRDRFEVLVADDGGSTDLTEILSPVTARIDARLLRAAHRGPAAARNLAASHARGSFLAFTDDDCTPQPRWLRALEEAHRQYPESAVGGAVRNALVDNPYSVASQLLVDYVVDYFARSGSQFQFATSSNLSFPAGEFGRLGGFDESFATAGGEDRELCHRWLGAGKPLRQAPEAVVDHHHALSLSRFWRQHFNYGRGAFVFRRRCPPVDRQRIEPASFYRRLLAYPAAVGFPQRRFVALMVVSQVANAAGFFAAAGAPGFRSTKQ